ncbi:BTAD domain-containing putative transcriptional regulator [Mycobacterium scrofulaceum]|uniref:BTAD domain-containing putative transcriptional regulator n=1 Tax=Mycobacterium scrofulaceum TaxID=1783 RepID=UPI003B027CB5
MELGVLGPLQVRQGGAPVIIPGAKPRAILSMLGLHGGSVVAADTLVELLWGEDPPRTAAKALQTHISSLRRTLGDGFVLTAGAGWTLAETQVDAARYKSAARLGRDAAAAGDTGQAVVRFEEALALWRGIPELPDSRRGTSEKTRWIEGHAALVEDRADALLATGRAAEIIGELEAAVADAPLRERRWGQLMLALYRAGRQGEALGAYQRARALLADELGVDPGPELRRLEAAIVAQDSSLETPAAQQLPSVTRAVTFLLTDIEGSTAAWEADAAAMAVALARHDELVEQVVTSRGGRLIKTRGEGDATFSVFDRPSAAAAAAIEVQAAIEQEPWALREPMRIRVALHTGEVELRDGDYFGRAVNRAARLRSLAVGGQILCSGATAELVIDSLPDDVVLADLGTRQLRNLARPEHVFELHLLTADDPGPAAPAEPPLERPSLPAVLTGRGPFVGRGRELERLASGWQTALAGGTNAMLIAGEPGVGKTRLAGEWSRQAYDQSALVIYGRCDEDLGAPYQPFAEALRSLVPCLGPGGLRGLRGVEALLTLIPGLVDVLPDLAAPTRADPDTERYALFDAVVALLALASARAPVVLILDDLHWAAKPTLLLLRHLLRFGEHARLQIIGTYRSTDLDRAHPLAAMLADLHRDGTASRLALSGLDEDDVTAYVAEAGYNDEELARALASVTGGNPFFLIEALRHVDESGGRWDQSTLPQGVREAVSRRLSRLPAEANKALAAAAVVGSRFVLELVERVVGDDLVDAFDEACKAGIVIEEPGGRYRFNHAIVRQSLLAELPSVRRMRLHQRIATTLESEPGADEELLAELAYHYFECAWAGNAAKAVEYCRRAADQAMARLAYEGAADLYDRALHALEEIDDELPDRDDQIAALLIARCEALLAAGDVASANSAVAQLQTATVDSAQLAAWATCFDGQLSMLIHPERLDEVETAVGAAASKLAELGDAAGEAKAHTVRAGCLARLGRIGDCEIALDDALTAARRAREHRRVNAVLAQAPLAALWGPNPVPRAGGRCLDVVRLLRITTDSPAVEATSTRCQAVLEAFRGRAAAARRMIDSARRTVTELGLRHALVEVEQFAGIVELVVDEPAAAEEYLRKAYNGFRRMGLDADTAETAALLGRTCLALDRDAEASELCSESERLAGHALKASIAWRTLRARLLSRGGDHDEARRIAQEAVALAERTDALVDHGDACLALATALGAAGDIAGARSAAARAVELYERKGAAALAERARGLVGDRGAATPEAPQEAPPPVELDNACVRAVRELDAAIDREAWEETERRLAPELALESRRKVVGFPRTVVTPSQWVDDVVKSTRALGGVWHGHATVAVRGDRLALTRLEVHMADTSPGAPRDDSLQLFGLDVDGRIGLHVWFDIDDIEAAMAELKARFKAEQPPGRRLENMAARVFEHVWSHFATRDWDALADTVADNHVGVDHRRVVSAETQYSRRAVVRDLQAAAEVGFTISMVGALAIRGERLVLARTRASGRDPGAVENDALNVVEIDADDRIANVDTYDVEDIESAVAELDTRYLAGEAAAHAHTWTVITRAYASLNSYEMPQTTTDFASFDHRTGAAFAPGDLVAYVRAAWNLAQDGATHIETVHRLTDVGAIVTHVTRGTSQQGFEAEWRELVLMTVDGDLISRCELFDEEDLDRAMARLDRLSQPVVRLENAATLAHKLVETYYAARDWDAIAAMVADDISSDDRRRTVNSGVRQGRKAVLEEMSATVAIGVKSMTSDVIATRGDRLALCRTQTWGRDTGPEAFHTDVFDVFELDADGKVSARIVFDLDDFGAAIDELDARYLAGEAATHAHTWSLLAEAFAALNQRKLPRVTPDWVNIDHRRLAPIGSGDLGAYLLATWELSPRSHIYIAAVHRLSNLGAVLTHVTIGTSPEGFDAEWQVVDIVLFDGDRMSRTELFDETDVDAAMARFDELSRPARQLENGATQTGRRYLALFAAGDWDAMAAMLDNNLVYDDRRRVVGAGPQHGRDAQIADMKTVAGLWPASVAATVVATRGTRLTLMRLRFADRDHGLDAFLTDVVGVLELNSEGLITSVVFFDTDDIHAALAELDSRYLAGEAADHARTWSVITEIYRRFNRHEVSKVDWAIVDHRRGTPFASGELTPALQTFFDLTPEFRVTIEAVHRLNNIGAVVTIDSQGSSRDGLAVEWRMIQLLTVAGDRLTRCEMFDETDLAAVIEQFDRLSQPAPTPQNAASRVVHQFLTHFGTHNWEAMAELLAGDFCSDDRRSVINAGIRGGRDIEMANWRATAEVWMSDVRATVVATRGENLALFRFTFTSQDALPTSFQAAALGVVEIDGDDRCAAAVIFDPDDIDAAISELDARYLAGEAAEHSLTWSVITHAYAAANRHELPPTTPDWSNVDHRRGIAFPPDNLAAYLEASWDLLAPGLRVYIEAVHRLTELGAVVTRVIEGTSSDDFRAEWREIGISTVDGDLINRSEIFDETELDRALARFEELQARPHRPVNAAGQVNERFWACLTTRDWTAMADLLAENAVSHDNRRVVNSGVLRGRDSNIANLRAVAEVGFERLVSTVLAIRGQRLALTRIWSSAQGCEPGEISADMVGVVEIDGDNRMIVHSIFDADDFDAAVAELEARYIAGEAAPHARVWSLVAQGHTQFNRHELPTMMPDVVYIDHRRSVTIEGADLAKSVRSVWELLPQVHVYVEAVHRLTERGAIVSQVVKGTSQEGFDAEWQTTTICTFEGDRLGRYEVFDETELDAALARFEQLEPPAPRYENAATRADQQFWGYIAARHWKALGAMLADDVANDDRRRTVNAGIRRGRDSDVANMRSLTEIGVTHVTSTIIATRGERLLLRRTRFSLDEGPEDFNVELLCIVELDAENRIATRILFDPDELDAAFEELDGRYLAGEAADEGHTWSLMVQTYAGLNRREMPATTPDFVSIDHRRGITFEPGNIVPYVQATWDVAPDLKMRIEMVHRLTNAGAVITHTGYGTSQDGFDAEWREVVFFTFREDRVDRCEMFDDVDVDAALARFEELNRPTPSLENAASRAEERLFAHSANADWAAAAEILSGDSVVDDRRRVVNVGFWDGRDAVIANIQALAEGLAHVALTVIATRGERLALILIRSFNSDPERSEFVIEMLGVAELDADLRISAHVFFDPDDMDAAFEELDARYLAGEAAPHAHTWSVIAGSYDAMNRRELFPTTPDWVNIDHRRPGIIEEGGLNASLLSLWQLTTDLTFRIEAVHRLTDLGMVCSHVAHGVSQDGFDAEWRGIEVQTVDGQLIDRCEIFDQADLDTALARFDELTNDQAGR